MNFTLDYNKWHHGGAERELKEFGQISLLNKEGFSCCIGLCALQMGLPPYKLLDNHEPECLNDAYMRKSVQLTKFQKVFTVSDDSHNDVKINNKLTNDAVAINDNESLTIKQRIDRLVALFKEYKHSLRFVNVPEGICT